MYTHAVRVYKMQNEPCCAIQSIDVVVVVRYTKVCPFMVSFICFFLELTDLLKSMYKNIIHIDKNNNLSVTPNFNHIHLMHGLERLPLAHIYTITPQFQYVFLPRLVDVIRLLCCKSTSSINGKLHWLTRIVQTQYLVSHRTCKNDV